MAMSVLIEDAIEIPAGIRTLAAFRRWTRSNSFPESGRIDYIGGRIEVDMSPERAWLHGQPKNEINTVLYTLTKRLGLGTVFVDRTRIVNVPVGLSCEPDVVFISQESFAKERVRLATSASGDSDDCVEIEGSPDLIVEVVSDSSVTKDLKRLPEAYFRAGVREYWVADARGKDLVFRIFHRGRDRYIAVKPDAKGYQRSTVLPRSFRLTRRRDELGHWVYTLRMKK